MRRSSLVFAVSALLTALAAAAPVDASAQTGGGTVAPVVSGGAQYGQLPPRRPQPLTVRTFRVAPATIRAGAESASLVFRVEGGAAQVRLRFSLMRAGDRVELHSVDLRARPGRRYTREVALPATKLTAGSYEAILKVTDARARDRGLRARRTVTRVALAVASPAPRPVPAPAPAPVAPAPTATAPAVAVGRGVFPVHGAYDFGGAGARFGSDRGGRLHRGQDIIAAEGTLLVAPRAGRVHHRAYQGAGAGHYLVIRGTDGRDYVFMHMREASPLTAGTAVAAGAPIGHVGNTGGSSGAHLHFEIWPDGWYAAADSQPIDPLPELLAWASG